MTVEERVKAAPGMTAHRDVRFTEDLDLGVTTDLETLRRVAESNVGRGHALVDDLSVSVSADTVPHPAEAAD